MDRGIVGIMSRDLDRLPVGMVTDNAKIREKLMKLWWKRDRNR